MQRISFTNALGESFLFQVADPLVLWEIKGQGLPDVTLKQYQAIDQHGFTFAGALLEAREVRVKGHVYARGGGTERDRIRRMFELREKLNSTLNPTLGYGTLLYETDFRAYKTAAVCKGIIYNDKIKNLQTLEIVFSCPDPFWRSKEPTETRLAFSPGTLTFPLETPGMLGMNEYSILAYNDGAQPAPIEIWIGSGAVEPTVTNETTGKYIRIKRDMDDFTSIYINTDPTALEVSLISVDPATGESVKEDAYQYLDDDSDPSGFLLAVGENRLTYRSKDDSLTTVIRLRYSKLYVGV